jgi:hypothetical protein
MEKIFGVKSDINSVIEMTEGYLSYLKKIKKEHGDITLNPNYVHLINKLFNSPDVMAYKR